MLHAKAPYLVQQFLRRGCFKHFPIYHYVKVSGPGARPYMTPGTSFEQTWISQKMIHTKYQWIPASGSWVEDFWKFIKNILIRPIKGASPFIWTNLNPHPKRIFPSKFCWNWLSGFRGEVNNVKSLQTPDERRRTTWTSGLRELKRDIVMRPNQTTSDHVLEHACVWSTCI